MAQDWSTAKRTAIWTYMVAVHLVLLVLLVQRYLLPGPFPEPQTRLDPNAPPANTNVTNSEKEQPEQPKASPTPPLPAALPMASVEPFQGRLIIPVQGIQKSELLDTYTDARSEGRVHNAIDIMAKVDTPVLATADGQIVRFHDSDRGGITIYQISTDKRYFFYYAHLSRRETGLAEGQMVRQGQTIGYVGDTGNAGPGNYHLHFSVSRVKDPKRFWDGDNINPYPILMGTPLQ